MRHPFLIFLPSMMGLMPISFKTIAPLFLSSLPSKIKEKQSKI